MMFSSVRNADRSAPYVMEFWADTEDDIKDLPTDCAPGSICIVIDTASGYVLNHKKEWKPI